MLLGYSFEPRPNSRALGTTYSGLGYDHRFIDKRTLALEKTSLTSPEADVKGMTRFRRSLLFSSSYSTTKKKKNIRHFLIFLYRISPHQLLDERRLLAGGGGGEILTCLSLVMFYSYIYSVDEFSFSD